MWNTSIRITSYRLYKNKSYLKRTIVFHHTGSITLWSTEDSNLFLVALIFKFSSWRFCVYKVIVTSLFYNLFKKKHFCHYNSCHTSKVHYIVKHFYWVERLLILFLKCTTPCPGTMETQSRQGHSQGAATLKVNITKRKIQQLLWVKLVNWAPCNDCCCKKPIFTPLH